MGGNAVQVEVDILNMFCIQHGGADMLVISQRVRIRPMIVRHAFHVRFTKQEHEIFPAAEINFQIIFGNRITKNIRISELDVQQRTGFAVMNSRSYGGGGAKFLPGRLSGCILYVASDQPACDFSITFLLIKLYFSIEGMVQREKGKRKGMYEWILKKLKQLVSLDSTQLESLPEDLKQKKHNSSRISLKGR